MSVPEKPTVLIVDDEPRIRELLLDLCPDLGLLPTAVRSAEEAIRVIDAAPSAPDILILDLQLPLTSGLDFLQALRERCVAAQVIILTGFGDLETARRAIHLNVLEFLTKPCPLSEIELALDRAKRALPDRRLQPAADVPANSDSDMSLAESEYHLIVSALHRSAGNKTLAATQLGISRRTLHYRLNYYRSLGYALD
jgi:DNA-binding NtrC family response regulator